MHTPQGAKGDGAGSAWQRERERSRGRGSALGAPDLGFPVAHEPPRARGGCGAGGQPPAGPGHAAPWPGTATAAGYARCRGRGRGAAARPGNAASQRHLPGRHVVGRWRTRTRATAASPRCCRRWPPWPRVGRDREREGADERERGRGIGRGRERTRESEEGEDEAEVWGREIRSWVLYSFRWILRRSRIR